MSSENIDIIRRVIRSFPVQINAGLLIEPPSFKGTFSHVLICGMGGSALAGRILKQYTRANGSHRVDVHDNYDLPAWVDAKTLIVALSYSGNTEETLSAFEKAHEQSLPFIAISTGGKLKERAQELSVPWFDLPTPDDIPRFQPRHSVPAQLGLLVSLLAVTTGEDIRETFRAASDNLEVEDLEEIILPLVDAVAKRTPIIYTSQALSAIGYNWKIQMNETAKRHTFTSTIPETNHNEIEATDHEHFHSIYLHDPDDHPRTNQRLQIMEQLKRKNGVKTTLIDLPGSTSLERHLNGILLGWWLGALTAEKSGVDPLAVNVIEAFKAKLNN